MKKTAMSYRLPASRPRLVNRPPTPSTETTPLNAPGILNFQNGRSTSGSSRGLISFRWGAVVPPSSRR